MRTKTTKLNQSQLRAAFWESSPSLQHHYRKTKRQNSYPCDVRCAWVDFVDAMHRGGAITDHTAHTATL
jgi:hypothetical protein